MDLPHESDFVLFQGPCPVQERVYNINLRGWEDHGKITAPSWTQCQHTIQGQSGVRAEHGMTENTYWGVLIKYLQTKVSATARVVKAVRGQERDP